LSKDTENPLPIRIDLEDLRASLNAVIDSVKARDGDVVTIEQDWFWEVTSENRHDFDHEPKTFSFTVGSYVDAWDGTKPDPEEPEVPFPDMALVWLSYLLRELGEKHLRD
jgi:hypothetical protein